MEEAREEEVEQAREEEVEQLRRDHHLALHGRLLCALLHLELRRIWNVIVNLYSVPQRCELGMLCDVLASVLVDV